VCVVMELKYYHLPTTKNRNSKAVLGGTKERQLIYVSVDHNRLVRILILIVF